MGNSDMTKKHADKAKRIQAVRMETQMSQKEMGERLGVSWRSYQNYELGLREMP
jgi:DNA-binding XRE family transcriptional regulator